MGLQALYYLTTVLLVVAALIMVALPLRTYRRTHQQAMVHLAIGFGLISAAAIVTTLSTRLVAMHDADGLLVVHNGITASGVLLVIYSLITYE